MGEYTATHNEFDSLKNHYNELRSLCDSYEREIQELTNIVRELRATELYAEQHLRYLNLPLKTHKENSNE